MSENVSRTLMYTSAFKLYLKSFFEAIPFAAFYVLGASIINYWLTFAERFAGFDLFLVQCVSLHIVLFMYSFSLTLNAIYRINSNQTFDHFEIAQWSIIRLIPTMIPVGIIGIVTAMAALLGFALMAIVPNNLGIILWFLFILGVLLITMIFSLVVYILFTSLLISVVGASVLESMKKSYKLIENRWIATSMLFLPIAGVKIILTMLFVQLGLSLGGGEVVSLFVFPFSACLVIVYFSKLQNDILPTPKCMDSSLYL